MIKAMAKGEGGKPTLIFGLSENNVQKLKDGFPISFEGKDMGVPEIDHVLIFYGKTERDMYDYLKKGGIKFNMELHDISALRKDKKPD